MPDIIEDPTRSDLNMIRTAITKGWDIPEQLMTALPKVAGTMALSGSTREKLAAMKVLIAMKVSNDKAEADRQLQAGTTINVGVQVAGTDHDIDARLEALNERIRLESLARDVPADGSGGTARPAKRKKRAKKKPAVKKRPVKKRKR